MKVIQADDLTYIFYCPGCKGHHGVWVDKPNPENGHQWTFHGTFERPTFSPSIHIHFQNSKGEQQTICHSFVKDGKIEFLGDCVHELKNQTVELPDVDRT